MDKLIPTGAQSQLFSPPISGTGWGSSNQGGHAVEIVGWDIGNAGPQYGNIPYWIVKNSWGANWCDNGYVKMAMNISKNGLDIPVLKNGAYFGGCVSFDIQDSMSNLKRVLLIVGILIIFLALVYVMNKLKNKRKK